MLSSCWSCRVKNLKCFHDIFLDWTRIKGESKQLMSVLKEPKYPMYLYLHLFYPLAAVSLQENFENRCFLG